MELPFNVVVAVVVAVIILLVIIALSFFVKDAGRQAIDYISNIPEFIKTVLTGQAK
jgi:predicted PurR-regulated permease PerM